MKRISNSIGAPLGLVLCLLVTGCAQRRHQEVYEARVAEIRSAYDQLSPADRKAVSERRIGEGMHKDVVLLSWGQPASVNRGVQGADVYETWSYSDYVPRMTHYQGMPGWHGAGYHAPSVGVDYVLRAAAIVNFRNDRVMNWQQWEDPPQTESQAGVAESPAEEEPDEEHDREAAPKEDDAAGGAEADKLTPKESDWEDELEFAPVGDEGEEIEAEEAPPEEVGTLAP